jgi:two-component system response regulator AtoC
LIKRVAPYDSNVLILGESGTGKEVVARCVHEQSQRSQGPYQIINCAGIPKELESSEFFGHEKGAFTGADKKRDGLLVRSNGGTLFMDELAELSQSAQAKLLRALQERVVMPVGSNKTEPFDSRLIFATNESVDEMVSAELISRHSPRSDDGSGKRMRADFYFRIGGIRIEIPPLRDRIEDLELLTEHAMRGLRQRFSKPDARLSDEAKYKLSQHKFPGNVRELNSILERAIVLSAGDMIEAEDVTFSTWNNHWNTVLKVGIKQIFESDMNRTLNLQATLDSCKRLVIVTAWYKNGCDLEKTRKELGISEQALISRLAEYGIVVK